MRKLACTCVENPSHEKIFFFHLIIADETKYRPLRATSYGYLRGYSGGYIQQCNDERDAAKRE